MGPLRLQRRLAGKGESEFGQGRVPAGYRAPGSRIAVQYDPRPPPVSRVGGQGPQTVDAWAGALLLFLIMAAVCVPAGIAAGGVFALLLRAVPPGVRGGGVRRPSRTIRHFAST